MVALVYNGKNETKVQHDISFPNGWEDGACELSLQPILKELGECGPTRLDESCGSNGV